MFGVMEKGRRVGALVSGTTDAAWSFRLQDFTGVSVMKTVRILGALVGVTLVASPALAASLNSKERARVSRASPRDRDDVRYCLLQGKKGRDKGTVIGAAGGAGIGAIAGGNLGESLLAGAAGAVAGRVIGKSEGTNSTCDRVLRRNP
jgi:outer membrane lipoprotein SlyB